MMELMLMMVIVMVLLMMSIKTTTGFSECTTLAMLNSRPDCCYRCNLSAARGYAIMH